MILRQMVEEKKGGKGPPKYMYPRKQWPGRIYWTQEIEEQHCIWGSLKTRWGGDAARFGTPSWPAGGVAPAWSSWRGVWHKQMDGWAASGGSAGRAEGSQGPGAGGSCSLIMCTWDGYHLGISACGNASTRHKGPSGCLWETEPKVLKPGHVSPLFLHPLNLVVPPLPVTCWQLLHPGPPVWRIKT